MDLSVRNNAKRFLFCSSVEAYGKNNGDIEKFSESYKMEDFYAPRITQIIEKYLGKGKKVGEMNRDQAEQLVLIIDDLKTL